MGYKELARGSINTLRRLLCSWDNGVRGCETVEELKDADDYLAIAEIVLKDLDSKSQEPTDNLGRLALQLHDVECSAIGRCLKSFDARISELESKGQTMHGDESTDVRTEPIFSNAIVQTAVFNFSVGAALYQAMATMINGEPAVEIARIETNKVHRIILTEQQLLSLSEFAKTRQFPHLPQ